MAKMVNLVTLVARAKRAKAVSKATMVKAAKAVRADKMSNLCPSANRRCATNWDVREMDCPDLKATLAK